MASERRSSGDPEIRMGQRHTTTRAPCSARERAPHAPSHGRPPSADSHREPTDNGLPTLTIGSRTRLSALTLEQLALARFEKERGLYVQREATLTKSGSRLQLDALHQSRNSAGDLLIEVRWIRKRFLDSPIFVQQVGAATEAYELFTGRHAEGVLILVTPDKPWANLVDLSQTSDELTRALRPPEVLVYTYAQLGFVPAALSADISGQRRATYPAPPTPKANE
jgi:hypothetical protein